MYIYFKSRCFGIIIMHAQILYVYCQWICFSVTIGTTNAKCVLKIVEFTVTEHGTVSV